MLDQQRKIKLSMDRSRGEVPPNESEPLEPGTLIIENEALRKGFTIIPNYILRDPAVSPLAKVIYTLLLSYAWQEGSCFPGQVRLARDLGVHKRSIIRSLQELKDKKFIAWKRRGMGKTNVYYILDFKPRGRKPDSEAEVTKRALLEVTQVADQEVTKSAHKEYSVEKDTVEEDSDLSKFRMVKTRKNDGDEQKLSSQAIARFMEDLSKHHLHDYNHINSNISNALNRWKESGMLEEKFIELMEEARDRTLKHTEGIRKTANGGRGTKNRAPYFFRVLINLIKETILEGQKRKLLDSLSIPSARS